MKSRTLISMAAAAVIASACGTTSYKTDEIGIAVTPSENREYSYTDKKSGYWYGRTHQEESREWYSGWNMAKKRVLADYTLGVNGQELNRADASCVVYPDRLVRQWNNVVETFQLVDDLPIIYIGMETEGETISCRLNLDLIAEVVTTPDQMLFIPHEDQGNCIMLAPANDVQFTSTEGGITTSADAGGFILTYGRPYECQALADNFRENGAELLKERKDRINDLITEYNPVKSNLPDLDRALDWITITMDELITCQQGNGIYAGLPWFNEYWGRDMFISMPGACLVTGQFEVAKEILKDFAKLQDTDPKSITYGRIPNRANLEGILYNTTDGTPRFVIQAYELAQYCGDTEFLADIYPAIKTSINASISNYTDEKGYLTHADADTWMDVKRNERSV